MGHTNAGYTMQQKQQKSKHHVQHTNKFIVDTKLFTIAALKFDALAIVLR
jgi:hypothetical protein